MTLRNTNSASRATLDGFFQESQDWLLPLFSLCYNVLNIVLASAAEKSRQADGGRGSSVHQT